MKLIKLTEDIKRRTLTEFEQKIDLFKTTLLKANVLDGSLNFEYKAPILDAVPQEIKNNLTRPKIIMDASTYLKMLNYVLKVETESGWHGLVKRLPNNVFHILDVSLYPQKVSAAYVEMDKTIMPPSKVLSDGVEITFTGASKYDLWKAALPSHQELTLRFQGHSHVNMATNPSGTDHEHMKAFMKDILSYLELTPNATDEELDAANSFYIFNIMNKRQDINWFLYDFKTNILYEREDIDFVVDYGNGYNTAVLEEEINTNLTPYVSQLNYSNTISGDLAWELKITNKDALDVFLQSSFYKLNKDSLWAQKDPNFDWIFYYAKDDDVNWELFRSSPTYQRTPGLVLMRTAKPSVKKKKTNKLNKLDKLYDKIEQMFEKGETPYIDLTNKILKYNEINKNHNNILETIGDVTSLTFSNDVVKTCYCIDNIQYIEDLHLDCISDLQAAGFSLRSVMLQGGY